jgi:hypothetical protein
MDMFFPIVRVLSALHKCWLQIDHLDQMIFVNKNQPFDLKIGCSKPFDLASACELQLTLIKKTWCKIWIWGWTRKFSFIFLYSFGWIVIFLVPHSPNIGIDLIFFYLAHFNFDVDHWIFFTSALYFGSLM